MYDNFINVCCVSDKMPINAMGGNLVYTPFELVFVISLLHCGKM